MDVEEAGEAVLPFPFLDLVKGIVDPRNDQRYWPSFGTFERNER